MRIAAGRSAEIDRAGLLQRARHLDRLVDLEAALRPIRSPRGGRRRTCAAAAPRAPPWSTSTIEPHAVFEAAAPAVGALVGERRQELVQQIAMRAMHLDEIEARPLGPPRGLNEMADHRLDAGLVERLRHMPAGREGDRRGAYRLPGVLILAERPAAEPWAPAVDALRPAWPSWMPKTVPGAAKRRATASFAATAASLASE